MKYHLHQSQTAGNQPHKPSKKRIDEDQLRLLETSFKANQKLKAELKLELACQLGLTPRQVAIWYQNRRAQHKTSVIEQEYRKIQLELDDVLAENIRLQAEVGMLKNELNNMQQMLLLASTPGAITFPLVSVSGDGLPAQGHMEM